MTDQQKARNWNAYPPFKESKGMRKLEPDARERLGLPRVPPPEEEAMTNQEKLANFEEECDRIDSAVDSFAKRMKLKLHSKAAKGFYGWDDPANLHIVREKMLSHAALLYCERVVYHHEVSQAIDVANLAMMCYRLGDSK